MKTLLNKKFAGLITLIAMLLLPVIAFAADEEPATEVAASGDGSGWVIVGLFIVVFFVLFVSLLAMGSGLAAAMIGYKLGKEDE